MITKLVTNVANWAILGVLALAILPFQEMRSDVKDLKGSFHVLEMRVPTKEEFKELQQRVRDTEREIDRLKVAK